VPISERDTAVASQGPVCSKGRSDLCFASLTRVKEKVKKYNNKLRRLQKNAIRAQMIMEGKRVDSDDDVLNQLADQALTETGYLMSTQATIQKQNSRTTR